MNMYMKACIYQYISFEDDIDDLNGILIPPLRDLPKCQDPTVMFDDCGIKLKEVRDFVHMARASSALGLNGISYIL